MCVYTSVCVHSHTVCVSVFEVCCALRHPESQSSSPGAFTHQAKTSCVELIREVSVSMQQCIESELFGVRMCAAVYSD